MKNNALSLRSLKKTDYHKIEESTTVRFGTQQVVSKYENFIIIDPTIDENSRKLEVVVLENLKDFNVKDYDKNQNIVVKFNDCGHIFTFGEVTASLPPQKRLTFNGFLSDISFDWVVAFGNGGAINHGHGPAVTFGDGPACSFNNSMTFGGGRAEAGYDFHYEFKKMHYRHSAKIGDLKTSSSSSRKLPLTEYFTESDIKKYDEEDKRNNKNVSFNNDVINAFMLISTSSRARAFGSGKSSHRFRTVTGDDYSDRIERLDIRENDDYNAELHNVPGCAPGFEIGDLYFDVDLVHGKELEVSNIPLEDKALGKPVINDLYSKGSQINPYQQIVDKYDNVLLNKNIFHSENSPSEISLELDVDAC